MLLPIYTQPNQILRQKAQPISEITPEIIELAKNMRETMHQASGIGLAAPQIGKSLAMVVIELKAESEDELSIPLLTLINPRITWKSLQKINEVEACLSVPGLEGAVIRPSRVRVKALNLEGKTIEIKASGLLARVLQHEIDHLDGNLFIDYVKKNQIKECPIVDYLRK